MCVCVCVCVFLHVCVGCLKKGRFKPSAYYACLRSIRLMYEIFLKSTVKTPAWRQWCCNGVFIINFEEILPIVLMFPLLILPAEFLQSLILNSSWNPLKIFWTILIFLQLKNCSLKTVNCSFVQKTIFFCWSFMALYFPLIYRY